MMIEDASSWNQLLLQLLSRSPTPWVIDDEVGNLERDLLVPEPALSYLRYDAPMTPSALTEIGFSEHAKHMGRLHNMTNFGNRDVLFDIGRRVAKRQILPEHFPPVFDLLTPPGGDRPPRGAAES